MYYYGLIGGKYHLEEIAFKVCDILGNGSNNVAHKLLVETAGAETHFGTYKDSTLGAGMGITQFDHLPFEDVKARTRMHHKKALIKSMDIDIDLVQWEELRYNPLLAMIFTRLKYKLVPEEIPELLEDRAKYWKKYYNTEAGKGSVEHYLRNNSTSV